MDFTSLRSVWAWEGIGPPTAVFPDKRALLQTEILPRFINCPGGWSQTIPQVKKPDMEVLGWRGYTWSMIVRPKTMLEAASSKAISIKFSGGHSSCQHANCTLPQLETSVALCCVTKLHLLELPFIIPSTRFTCVMIMLFKQLFDMPHLLSGWIILAKEKCSLTGI
jgi:hypothetical protein